MAQLRESVMKPTGDEVITVDDMHNPNITLLAWKCRYSWCIYCGANVPANAKFTDTIYTSVRIRVYDY